MTATTLRSPDYYRLAADDIVHGRSTEAAQALLAEAQADLEAGQPVKGVEKALKAKGAKQWAAAVAAEANRRNWRQILETGSREYAEGLTETARQQTAFNLVDAMLSDDPLVSTLPERLESAGASPELAAYLASHPKARKSQLVASWWSIGFGLAAAAFGVYLFATASPTGPDKPQPGMLFIIVMGLGLAGKGVSGLLRK